MLTYTKFIEEVFTNLNYVYLTDIANVKINKNTKKLDIELKNNDFLEEFVYNFSFEQSNKKPEQILIPMIPISTQKKIIESISLLSSISKESNDIKYNMIEKEENLFKVIFDFSDKNFTYVRLKDVCELVIGSDVTDLVNTNSNNEVKYINERNLTFITNSNTYVSQNVILNNNLKVIEKDTIIMDMNLNVGLINKFKFKSIINSNCCALFIDETKIRNNFLFRFLIYDYLYLKQITKIKNISDLENFLIPLPSIKEQDEILYQFYSCLDEMIFDFNSIKELSRSRFIYYLNCLCNINIPEITKVKLKDICDIVIGDNYQYSAIGKSIPFITSDDLSYGKINTPSLDINTIDFIGRNNIIIGLEGKNVGKFAINKDICALHKSCCALVLKSKQISENYLFYALMAKINEINNLISNGKLSIIAIKNIEVSIPSVHLQREISNTLKEFDNVYKFLN